MLIKVIYNFIDFEQYPEIESEECQRHTIASENERIITHVSNLRPVKRAADVIDIFYKVQKVIPSKLLLVGEGPDRENNRQCVQPRARNRLRETPFF